MLTLENNWIRYSIGADGTNVEFGDKASGRNYASSRNACCLVKIGTKEYGASAAKSSPEGITVEFGTSGAAATLRGESHEEYLVLEVVSLEGEGVTEFTFLDLPLSLQGKPEEPFAACALALDLQTNVTQIPQPSAHLRASCYPRFGFAGAKAAIIGCPQGELREVMKTVVREAEGIPHSPLGGPFALDAEETRGSYLMDTRASVTESTVGNWIRLANDLGVRQLDFHAGTCLRFGDYEPNRDLYPNGIASVRAVTDKLREAGILSGLHTYAFFLAKDTPWVTPIPHPALAKDATFTLASSLPADATSVHVIETTERMSTETGFFVANSVTLQIGDELIVYHGLEKEHPYRFTECERGAYGTQAAPHDAGAKVYHLKELFGLFLPEPDSDLFYEVIERTASAYNEGGFSMMYLDALDGAYTLAGWENAWHYGSKFVFELMKRVERPPIMEMSTFHHHLWYVRSRIGAWDFAKRSYKDFIDLHVLANQQLSRAFLPSHLGWWGIWPWSGQDIDRMFPDDIEYLCCKALAHDSGLSWIHGIDPDGYPGSRNMQRLASIIRRYEDLRLSGAVPKNILDRIRKPQKEFTLEKESENGWSFCPVRYAEHKVDRSTGSRAWNVENPFEDQPVRLRIEAMLAAAEYDDPESGALLDFSDTHAFTEKRSEAKITSQLSFVENEAVLAATSEYERRDGAWTMVGMEFEEPRNLISKGLGVWVEGDGNGEILNFQVKSPMPMEGGFVDHYVEVDFKGRRYFEFVEPETTRMADYNWPYCPRREDWNIGGRPYILTAYSCFYLPMDRGKVNSFRLWYNNLPQGQPVSCRISPIRILPLRDLEILDPSVSINGKEITFSGSLKSGEYIDFISKEDCQVYDANGEPVRTLVPEGDIPILGKGRNKVHFTCKNAEGSPVRAWITVITRGAPISWESP